MVLIFFVFSYFSFLEHDVSQEVENIHQNCYQLLEVHPDSALANVDQALQISEEANFTWGMANSYYIKGYIFHKVKNKAITALLMYLRAGKLLEPENDPTAIKTLADVYINAGSILRIHGKMDEAIRLYDIALNKIASHDEKERKLMLLFNKAYALHDKENFEDAVATLRLCIDLARSLENQVHLNDSWNLLGDTMLKAGNVDEAIKCFQFVIQNQKANADARANSSNNLGDFYLSISNFEEAKYYYQLSIDLSSDLSIPTIPFYGYTGLSRCYLKERDYINGIISGERAMMLYDSIIPEDDHLLIFDLMSDFYALKGDLVRSNFYANKYIEEATLFFDTQKELINIKNEFQIDLLLAGFYSEIKLESTKNQESQIVVVGGTILIGVILIMYMLYRRKLKTSRREIVQILKGVK